MNKRFVFHSSVNKSIEWYTPNYIFKKLNIEFDLDPASNEFSNSIVKAKKYFIKEDDGLAKDWNGKVWLNPPYGKLTKIWIQKAIEEYEKNDIKIIVLLFARTDTSWFHESLQYFQQVCFTRGRIKFINGTTKEVAKDSPSSGSIFLSIGNEMNEAVKKADFGTCINLRGK